MIFFTKIYRKIEIIPGHTWVGLLGADQGSLVGDRAEPAKKFPVGLFLVALVEGALLLALFAKAGPVTNSKLYCQNFNFNLRCPNLSDLAGHRQKVH